MTSLTAVQVATAAHRGGWPLPLIPFAVAISLAENGDSDPDKLGDTTITTAQWGPSVGLWQIRSLNDQKGRGGPRDEIANHDPVTNARNAYTIFKQQGWAAWTDYRNGKYLRYIVKATQALAQAVKDRFADPLDIGSKVADVAAGAASVATSAREGLAYVDAGRKWLADRHNWTRIAWFAGGGVLLVGALMQSGAGDKVASIAGEAGKLAVTKGKR